MTNSVKIPTVVSESAMPVPHATLAESATWVLVAKMTTHPNDEPRPRTSDSHQQLKKSFVNCKVLAMRTQQVLSRATVVPAARVMTASGPRSRGRHGLEGRKKERSSVRAAQVWER